MDYERERNHISTEHVPENERVQALKSVGHKKTVYVLAIRVDSPVQVGLDEAFQSLLQMVKDRMNIGTTQNATTQVRLKSESK